MQAHVCVAPNRLHRFVPCRFPLRPRPLCGAVTREGPAVLGRACRPVGRERRASRVGLPCAVLAAVLALSGPAQADEYEPPERTFQEYLDQKYEAEVREDPWLHRVGAMATFLGIVTVGGAAVHYALMTGPAAGDAQRAHDAYAGLAAGTSKAGYDGAWAEFEAKRTRADELFTTTSVLGGVGLVAVLGGAGIMLFTSNPKMRSVDRFPQPWTPSSPPTSPSMSAVSVKLGVSGPVLQGVF